MLLAFQPRFEMKGGQISLEAVFQASNEAAKVVDFALSLCFEQMSGQKGECHSTAEKRPLNCY